MSWYEIRREPGAGRTAQRGRPVHPATTQPSSHGGPDDPLSRHEAGTGVSAADETQLLLVEHQGRSLHIVDLEDPTRTYCGRPLAGEALTPALWHGDAKTGPRQRTVYDVRWRGRIHGICKPCRECAGVES